MNRLARNFPTEVCRTKSGQFVSDGRTFSGWMDHGYDILVRRKIQLLGVELPDTRANPDPEVSAKFDRAKQCLSLALFGPKALAAPAAEDPSVPGRRIMVSPLRPNEFGRALVRAYIQVARANIMFEHLCHSAAGYHFLDVGAFMQFTANYGWNLDKAQEVLGSFELIDVVIE